MLTLYRVNTDWIKHVTTPAGVLPQAPMHSRSLLWSGRAEVVGRLKPPLKLQPHGRGSANADAGDHSGVAAAEEGVHGGTNGCSSTADGKHGSLEAICPAEPADACQLHVNGAADAHVPAGELRNLHLQPVVQEQRVSNLLQSLLVAACLGATPAIKQIPTSALWGYFAFMALESLPGSQFWERLCLLVADARQRASQMRESRAPYAGAPFRQLSAFTAFQAAWLAGVWALVTWAGIAGIAFPVPIMALVPLRMYVLPRFFDRRVVNLLDPDEASAEPPVVEGETGAGCANSQQAC